MSTQSQDTCQEAERVQVELLRKATIERRLELGLSLSQEAMEIARAGILQANPSKLEWYKMGGGVSERQLLDVLCVLKVQGPRLDLDYLRHWAAEIGVADLLSRALEEAGLQ